MHKKQVLIKINISTRQIRKKNKKKCQSKQNLPYFCKKNRDESIAY